LLAFVYPRLTRADIDAGGSFPHNWFLLPAGSHFVERK
jgi:hypothetical protein